MAGKHKGWPKRSAFHPPKDLTFHRGHLRADKNNQSKWSMSTTHASDTQTEPLSPEERSRRREWNRGPVTDLFPRIPPEALEQILDICIDNGFTYNLSRPKYWNARRYTSITVAHVRHAYSDYEALLRGEDRLERYEARHRTATQVWKTLREWCPWEESNDQLERCFRVTLLRPEERDPEWDPMDIDGDSDFEDDPMDLD